MCVLSLLLPQFPFLIEQVCMLLKLTKKACPCPPAQPSDDFIKFFFFEVWRVFLIGHAKSCMQLL